MSAILIFQFSPKSIGFFYTGSSMVVPNINFIWALVSQIYETQIVTSFGVWRRQRQNRKKYPRNFRDIIICFDYLLYVSRPIFNQVYFSTSMEVQPGVGGGRGVLSLVFIKTFCSVCQSFFPSSFLQNIHKFITIYNYSFCLYKPYIIGLWPLCTYKC